MRLNQKFKQLKEKNEAALILYITAGFPTLESSINQIKILSENGADIIEVGIPFSDPIADGSTIQYASQLALERGISLKCILDSLMKIKVKTPLVMMSYYNPLLAYGLDRLLEDCKKSDIQGLIVPDLPVEESQELCQKSEKMEMDNIFLITPNSSSDRIDLVTKHSTGFVYCVSITGTTGIRKNFSTDLKGFLKQVRSRTSKPIAVGFGISTQDHIHKLKNDVDGVIIGSRIIESIRKDEDTGALVRELKDATRRNSK